MGGRLARAIPETTPKPTILGGGVNAPPANQAHRTNSGTRRPTAKTPNRRTADPRQPPPLPMARSGGDNRRRSPTTPRASIRGPAARPRRRRHLCVLMKTTLHLGTVCILFATCAGAPAPSQEASNRLDEARRQLAAGDVDAALAITDQLTREVGGWKDVWIVAGDGNLALSKVERQGLNTEYVLRDAESAYLRATAIDGTDAVAWQGLAQARLQLRDFESARGAALRATELWSNDKAKTAPAAAAAALLIAANCDLQRLAQARQDERQGGTPDHRGVVPIETSTAQLAQLTMQEFEAVQAALPGEGFAGAAQVYQWIDQDDNAVLELERGIRAAPDAGAVHMAFQDLHVRMGQQRALVGAYARFLRENPGVPILYWYQGRAEVVVADDLRSKSSFAPAIDAYRKAAASYGQYAAMVPAHQATAQQWNAICELSIARSACDLGDLDSSKEHLFAAAAASPLTTDYDGLEPRLKDSFGSHFAGVVFAIGRALSSGGEGSLAATLAFHEEIIARWPGKWGFVYNNAALPARDLGVLMARNRDGKSDDERRTAMTQAMALWEKSYRYYEEAARLSPDDARIQNDCGLMLIYHLNRDFDHARELFDRAIAAGQLQLDTLPADASVDDRNFLEEAVGDAWQNIGVLMSRHLHRPFAEMKPFLDKAITYYPYRQREAARMLDNEGRESAGNGMNPRTLRGAAGSGAAAQADAAAPAAAQGGAAEELAKLQQEVEALAKGGDLDGAMTAIDKAQKQLKDFAPFQLFRGQYALRYAKEARDQQRKGVEFLFADAVDALHKAVELDSEPIAPRQLLAEAQFEQGTFSDAVRTVSALLLHLQSLGGGKNDEVGAAHRVRANAASLALLADPQSADRQQLLTDARLSFRWLEQQRQLDLALTKNWANLEAAASAPGEAVGVYTRALQRTPDDQQLLAAVVDTAIANGQAALAVDALQQRDDAAGLWYLGRARFEAASDLRIGGRIDQALQELDQARSCFAQSMQKNADFADSCQQWLAICLGKKGNAALAQKDWAHAEQWLLESVRLRPDQIGQPLGLQESTKLGVMKLADHFLQAKDLAKTEAIYQAVTEHAQGDLDLLNNEGLFARDYGAELEKDGKDDEAKVLYERSYAAYGKAHALDPANVQLRNDLALMAIQYLGRDWDQSKQLLDSAIADGERLLADFPADDTTGRQQLDSAVGDCWENIAQWQLLHGHDAKAAKAAAERSLQHWPGAQRVGARRHLRAAEKLLQENK